MWSQIQHHNEIFLQMYRELKTESTELVALQIEIDKWPPKEEGRS
jgi:hypothetical protein